MKIRFKCEGCGVAIVTQHDHIGWTGKCRRCARPFTVPDRPVVVRFAYGCPFCPVPSPNPSSPADNGSSGIEVRVGRRRDREHWEPAFEYDCPDCSVTAGVWLAQDRFRWVDRDAHRKTGKGKWRVPTDCNVSDCRECKAENAYYWYSYSGTGYESGTCRACGYTNRYEP